MAFLSTYIPLVIIGIWYKVTHSASFTKIHFVLVKLMIWMRLYQQNSGKIIQMLFGFAFILCINDV